MAVPVTLSSAPAADLTPAEARVIAKEAYIYGYPMVDSYRIMRGFSLVPGSPEFKAPPNQLKSIPRLFTPDDKMVQTPNSDTPYSIIVCDLRAEPLVLTVPAIPKERYYSIQLIDTYTHNFAYIGSRATGAAAGSYLLAGPGWKGVKPPGINAILTCETNLVLGIYRTQVFGVDDLPTVVKIQAGYGVKTLSAFLGTSALPAAPTPTYPDAIEPAKDKTSLRMFSVLNFVLGYCPTVPSEQELMARFARIGVGAGRTFAPDALARDQSSAGTGRRRRLGRVRGIQGGQHRHRQSDLG